MTEPRLRYLEAAVATAASAQGGTMLKGFKDFLLRGNIVDLAVAVVIGTAFTALVAAFTATVINPLIARAGGGEVGDGLYLKLGDNPETWIRVGDFLTAVITFIITAAVVYFLVVIPMRRVMTRLDAQEEAAAELDEQTELLREIRNALVARGTGGETTRT
jgi:large conductance mechanosensitive channel